MHHLLSVEYRMEECLFNITVVNYCVCILVLCEEIDVCKPKGVHSEGVATSCCLTLHRPALPRPILSCLVQCTPGSSATPQACAIGLVWHCVMQTAPVRHWENYTHTHSFHMHLDLYEMIIIHSTRKHKRTWPFPLELVVLDKLWFSVRMSQNRLTNDQGVFSFLVPSRHPY